MYLINTYLEKNAIYLLRSIPCYANMLITLNIFKKQQLSCGKLFKFDMLPTEYNREMVHWRQTDFITANVQLQLIMTSAKQPTFHCLKQKELLKNFTISNFHKPHPQTPNS